MDLFNQLRSEESQLFAARTALLTEAASRTKLWLAAMRKSLGDLPEQALVIVEPEPRRDRFQDGYVLDGAFVTRIAIHLSERAAFRYRVLVYVDAAGWFGSIERENGDSCGPIAFSEDDAGPTAAAFVASDIRMALGRQFGDVLRRFASPPSQVDDEVWRRVRMAAEYRTIRGLAGG